MSNVLSKTWDEMAYFWNDWAPPLRPSPEDARLTRPILARWHAENPLEKVRVFMCGVTPEIAGMDWPFPVELVGMDQSENMVRVVWPGDIPGVRRALVGNWLSAGIPPGSRDIVIGDGGFGFFSHPEGQRSLISEIRKMLQPRGLFVYRHFAHPPEKEHVADVIADAKSGRIGGFFAFRWRLAMALQPDSRQGVKQDDIWQAWIAAGIDATKLPQPGWSARAVETVRFSKGKESSLYFPTLEEFRTVLAEMFDKIEVVVPTYELGDRCPIITARPRVVTP